MLPNFSIALFSTMFVLAIVPSPSVFAVVVRATAAGFIHGAITTAGIVFGDLIFILVAVLGLWTIAEAAGHVFFLIKYVGSVYLIYLGIVTWRSKPQQREINAVNELSWLSNFMCGLLITLSDPKAILFYTGFLPAYVDLSSISVTETVTILLSAMIAVGGAKLIYAYLADKARFVFRSARIQTTISRLAGTALVGTGIFLAVKG